MPPLRVVGHGSRRRLRCGRPMSRPGGPHRAPGETVARRRQPTLVVARGRHFGRHALSGSILPHPARARSPHLIACSPLFDGLGTRERPTSIQDLFPRLIQPYDVIPSRYDRHQTGDRDPPSRVLGQRHCPSRAAPAQRSRFLHRFRPSVASPSVPGDGRARASLRATAHVRGGRRVS